MPNLKPVDMKKPAFQFYVQDFITGTLFFTAEETGAYIRLLCYQWDKGFVPDDEVILTKITGVKKKSSIINVMVKFIKGADGHYYNEKLERVRKAQEDYVKKQTVNGAKGGRPKVNPPETQEKPNPNPEESQQESQTLPKKTSSTSTSTSTSGESTPAVDLKNSNLYRQPKIPSWEDVHRVFIQQGGTEEMAKKFFENNQATGWFKGTTPIVNFSTLVPGFMASWKNFDSKNEPSLVKKMVR